jgi:hypothetical protein
VTGVKKEGDSNERGANSQSVNQISLDTFGSAVGQISVQLVSKSSLLIISIFLYIYTNLLLLFLLRGLNLWISLDS